METLEEYFKKVKDLEKRRKEVFEEYLEKEDLIDEGIVLGHCPHCSGHGETVKLCRTNHAVPSPWWMGSWHNLWYAICWFCGAMSTYDYFNDDEYENKKYTRLVGLMRSDINGNKLWRSDEEISDK